MVPNYHYVICEGTFNSLSLKLCAKHWNKMKASPFEYFKFAAWGYLLNWNIQTHNHFTDKDTL